MENHFTRSMTRSGGGEGSSPTMHLCSGSPGDHLMPSLPFIRYLLHVCLCWIQLIVPIARVVVPSLHARLARITSLTREPWPQFLLQQQILLIMVSQASTCHPAYRLDTTRHSFSPSNTSSTSLNP